MIDMKDNRISMYEGDYRPVEAMRNGQKLAGWKTVGMTGTEGEFTDTYNDFLTVYGKSGYRESVNLCPPPEAKTMNDGIIEVVLTPTNEGRFDLTSQTVSNDVVMMMSPNILHSVTLPAGTYTASSNSAEIGYSPGDESCFDLPYTFTLEAEQMVYFGTYTTDFSETDLYLQIESGETATDYDPYAGDPAKAPSPDNVRPLVSAQGEITTGGKNLLQFFQNLNNISSETATVIEILENGIIIRGNFNPNTNIQSTVWSNGWYFYAENSEILHLNAGDIVTVSADYTVLELHPNRTGNEPIFIHFYSKDAAFSKQQSGILKPVGETMRVCATFIVNKAGYYWPIFSLNSNLVKIENIQIEYGSTATPYQPYLVPHNAVIPELRGIEVTATAPYNYSETVDGVTRYYISDVLQGDQLIRNVGVLVLDGTENWSTYALANDAGFCLYNIVPSVASNAISCLSNAFVGITREEMYRGGLGISFGAAQELRISQNYDTFGQDTAQLKAYLSERYAVGDPVTVYYALAEPQIETLSEYPKTLPCYTRVVAGAADGCPDFGLGASVKVQES